MKPTLLTEDSVETFLLAPSSISVATADFSATTSMSCYSTDSAGQATPDSPMPDDIALSTVEQNAMTAERDAAETALPNERCDSCNIAAGWIDIPSELYGLKRGLGAGWATEHPRYSYNSNTLSVTDY